MYNWCYEKCYDRDDQINLSKSKIEGVFFMKKTLSKILAVICMVTLVAGTSLPAFAIDTHSEVELTKVSNDFPLSKGVDIESIKNGLQSATNSNEMGSISPQALTDPYEPNDTSGTAATIPYNQFFYANIGTASDQDWYKIYLTASSDPDDIVAFLLKDIPSGCDYDLYIFDPNGNYAASQKAGNADERLYVQIATTGTWNVAVVSYSGYNDNANYKVFVGDAWQNGNTGWMPTNLTFNFTPGTVGTILPYQVFDLRYNASIPDSAQVRNIQIDSSGTGDWGNQIKYIIPAQTGIRYETYVGLDYVLNIPENTLYVKQQWGISTSIQNLFIPTSKWTPYIYFAYRYVIE